MSDEGQKDQKDGAEINMLTLDVINTGSISGITCGPLNTVRSYSTAQKMEKP